MAATLKALQRRRDRAAIELETRQLESQLRESTISPLTAGWEAWPDPRELYIQQFGQMPGAMLGILSDDRGDGSYGPVYRNLQELGEIRAIARWLMAENETAICAMYNYANYVLGTGFQYKVTGDQEELVSRATEVLDEFSDRADWMALQREQFTRLHRDGEFFLRCFTQGQRSVFRFVEPEFVVEPDRPSIPTDALGEISLDWTLGVGTTEADVEQVRGYFVQWPGSDADFEVLPAQQVQHARTNVDSGIKRGVSDFFPVSKGLQRIEKLARNMGEGAALQAAIAMIREHAQGVSQTQVNTFVAGRADVSTNATQPSGATRTTHTRRYDPGTIVDIPAGMKYTAGPMGSPKSAEFATVLNVLLRRVGSRWCMPEYMISSDASNANYASTLVAGSPFVKACLVEQRSFKRQCEQVLWKVLANAAEYIGLPPRELRKQVKVDVVCPQVDITDPLQQEQLREIRHRAGILSKETWASEVGLDYEAEKVKSIYQPPPTPVVGQQPQGDPARRAAVAAALESVRTTADARRILEDCGF